MPLPPSPFSSRLSEPSCHSSIATLPFPIVVFRKADCPSAHILTIDGIPTVPHQRTTSTTTAQSQCPRALSHQTPQGTDDAARADYHDSSREHLHPCQVHSSTGKTPSCARPPPCPDSRMSLPPRRSPWFFDSPSPLSPFSVLHMALARRELGKDVGHWFAASCLSSVSD